MGQIQPLFNPTVHLFRPTVTNQWTNGAAQSRTHATKYSCIFTLANAYSNIKIYMFVPVRGGVKEECIAFPPQIIVIYATMSPILFIFGAKVALVERSKKLLTLDPQGPIISKFGRTIIFQRPIARQISMTKGYMRYQTTAISQANLNQVSKPKNKIPKKVRSQGGPFFGSQTPFL